MYLTYYISYYCEDHRVCNKVIMKNRYTEFRAKGTWCRGEGESWNRSHRNEKSAVSSWTKEKSMEDVINKIEYSREKIKVNTSLALMHIEHSCDICFAYISLAVVTVWTENSKVRTMYQQLNKDGVPGKDTDIISAHRLWEKSLWMSPRTCP